MEKIKTVLIGLGYRGQYLLELMRKIPSFHVSAVFDPQPEKKEMFDLPLFSEGVDDYQRMINIQHPDLVVVASPWQFHIEQALYAVNQGCHVALEIKGGLSVDEYLPLIELAEKKGLYIFPLENTVFMRENMAMINLVEDGVLGSLVAMRGGYRHDLRSLLLDSQGNLGNPDKPEGIWRSRFYVEDNGDLYPTHGLAPLCLIAGIGRTDKIVELTSFASCSCGINEYVRQCGSNSSLNITMGDIIITQMKTGKGILITLTHDTTLPRPRSLDFELQGSKGIWRGEFRQIYVEGHSQYEKWEDDSVYINRYEHDYWQRWGKVAVKYDFHHRGMDYIMLQTLAAALEGKVLYPMNGKDLALWTSVSPYSKLSIAEGSKIFLH